MGRQPPLRRSPRRAYPSSRQPRMEVQLGMKASLKCHCGQRIFSRDVMQQGYYVRQFGPSYVYVRFRCSRCKKLGEHFVKQEEWDEAMLRDDVTEVTTNEKRQFDRMGEITVEEMVRFHHELEQLDALPQLAED